MPARTRHERAAESEPSKPLVDRLGCTGGFSCILFFYQQKQIQIFRQQIQRREYHISRIIETKYPEFSLPEDKLKVLVTKWEIVKQKVTVLEERIWEVGRHVRKDGKLGNLLLWLHEAEALLNYYETDESWVCEVPAKFLLRQHEVSVGFV